MLRNRKDELAFVRLIDVKWLCLSELKDVNISENAFNCVISDKSFSQSLTVEFPIEGGVRIFTGKGGFFKPSALNPIDTVCKRNGEWVLKSGDITAVIKSLNSGWTIKINDAAVGNNFLLKSSNIKFGVNKDGLVRVLFCGKLADDEIFCGGGERYNTFILNNTAFPLWNTDRWSQDSSTYVNVPFFHSSKGYSLFYNSTYGAIADIGYTSSKRYDLDFNGDIFDIYFYLQEPLENIDCYTRLTGRPFSIPKWAFGYWAGGAGVYWDSRDKDGKHNYLELVKETAEGYKRLGTMPIALYGEARPSDNKDAYELLDSYGIKMLGWNHPGATWDIREFNVDILRELCPGVPDSELPGIRRRSNPSEFYSTEREWVWGDYTNPTVEILIKNKMKKVWDYGLKGAMVDYGEYVDEPMLFANGKTGDEMHNLYAYYYNRATMKAWYDRMGGDCVLFARAGCAGSHHYCASFGGDQGSTFDGLRKALSGGLSISVSGFSGWGSDIGGLGGTPTKELYMRWLEFGTFSPFMRAHGPTDHNPWSYGKKAEEVFKKLYWTRMGLVDLLYSANLKTANTGEPIMKPMMLCYPKDKECWRIEDQYILADELMVCPVYTEGTRERVVYFPEGNWYDLFGGNKICGAKKTTVSVPLGKPAVYLREGAIIKTSVSSEDIFFGKESVGETLNAVVVTPTSNYRKKGIFTDGGVCEVSLSSKRKNTLLLEHNGSETISVLNLLGAKLKGIKAYSKDLNDVKEITEEEIKYCSKQKLSAAVLPDGWSKLELFL